MKQAISLSGVAALSSSTMPSQKPTQFGTAVGKPAHVARGEFPLVELPTGGMENLPVVIVTGSHEGPTVLLTANIHGPEVIGTLVCHRFIEHLARDLSALRGTVVVIPSLNPSGLRHATRFSEHQNVDPNRKWPGNRGSKKKGGDEADWLAHLTELEHAPGPQERAWEKLFGEFRRINPVAHLDLHSFTILSMPFAFLDRFFYRTDAEKVSQTELAKKTESMLDALDISVFREASFRNMVRTDMYRTTSGSVLNELGIPAATIELGASVQANQQNVEGMQVALSNWLKWVGLLPGAPKATGFSNVRSKVPLRTLQYPYAPVAGILDPIWKPGEAFKKGDTLAVMRSISGVRLTEIKAEVDGYLVGWRNGIAHYQGNPLAWVAVEDRMELVGQWPVE